MEVKKTFYAPICSSDEKRCEIYRRLENEFLVAHSKFPHIKSFKFEFIDTTSIDSGFYTLFININ